MRRYSTVEERVRQVREAGIPYWSFNGEPEVEECVSPTTNGFLHLSEECLSVTPEMSISGLNVDSNRRLGSGTKVLDKKFVPALNKAAGVKFSEEEYTRGEGRSSIDSLKIRVHFIYDSISDMTHCFALPDIERLSKK